MIDISFHPIWKPEVPTLRVTEVINAKREYRFQCIDSQGETHVETFHVNLADALEQVVARMRIEQRGHWRVEIGIGVKG